ncbi:MAG: YceD family protein [Propionibacteriaceae bacterium]
MSPHQPSPDVRSSLVIQTHELRRGAGQMCEIERVAQAPAELGTDVIGVPQGSPIDLELRLESVSEGILVSGFAKAELVGECVRCLDTISQPCEIDMQELYVYPEGDAEVDEDDDTHYVVNDCLDLEPLIRDAVVLELPFAPLCSEDCLGLCPTCGLNLNHDPQHDHGEVIDERWTGLAGWNSGE